MVSERESLHNLLRGYNWKVSLEDSCKPRIIDPQTGQVWRFRNTLNELEKRSRELRGSAEESFLPSESLTPGGCLLSIHLEEALATAPDNPEGILEIVPYGIKAT